MSSLSYFTKIRPVGAAPKHGVQTYGQMDRHEEAYKRLSLFMWTRRKPAFSLCHRFKYM